MLFAQVAELVYAYASGAYGPSSWRFESSPGHHLSNPFMDYSRKFLSLILTSVYLVYISGLLFFMLFPEHYLRDLLINFLPYIVALHLPFFLLFLSLHLFSEQNKNSTRRFLFVLIISIFLQGVSLLRPYFESPKSFASSTHESPKIISANVYKANTDYQATVDFIDNEDPDVFGLVELTDGFVVPLRSLASRYPYHLSLPAPDGFGIGLWSKTALINPQLETLPGNIPFIRAQVELSGNMVTIFLVHAMPPLTPKMFEERNQSLQRISSLIEGHEHTIVMGDFNLTPWSAYFTQFVKDADLVSTRTMWNGLQMSWQGWGFHLPIDHFFVSRSIRLASLEIGEDIHSDHRPVVAEIAIH